MKTTYGKMTPWMAALVCLTLANAPRAAADDADATKPAAGYKNKTETTSSEGAPAKCNKASSLIGMDVRNPSNEHLGHIKDLVFDLKTERISYAVMSVSPRALLGNINEKLLAVPLNALSMSPDEKHIVLNADKAKVEAAAGFDKDSWPSISSPSWGAEPFWLKTSAGATEKPTPPKSDTEPKDN